MMDCIPSDDQQNASSFYKESSRQIYRKLSFTLSVGYVCQLSGDFVLIFFIFVEIKIYNLFPS